MDLEIEAVRKALWSAGVAESFLNVLLGQYQKETQKKELDQPEKDYLVGWERLSALLTDEQMELLEALDSKCAEEAEIGLIIALDRGHYAGFQHFFQPDEEPLTFEKLVLSKLLTVPEVMRFPQYDHARMQANELETELSEQLDPFSREHLTSITSAWEERSMAMLRYGFALGYQEALTVVGQIAPKKQVLLTERIWQMERELGIRLRTGLEQ